MVQHHQASFYPRAGFDDLLAIATTEQVGAAAKKLRIAAGELPDPAEVAHAYSSVGAYGGGRAGLLLDGTLLEVKSIAPKNGSTLIDRGYAYQLLGYLLTLEPGVVARLDGGVQHVGGHVARHGLTRIRDVDEFLSEMANTPVTLTEAAIEADSRTG